jgi:succinate dehydrogenase / fumarate reductase cytochrome b subunit
MDTHHEQVTKEFGHQTAVVVLGLTLGLTAILGAKLFGIY